MLLFSLRHSSSIHKLSFTGIENSQILFPPIHYSPETPTETHYNPRQHKKVYQRMKERKVQAEQNLGQNQQKKGIVSCPPPTLRLFSRHSH